MKYENVKIRMKRLNKTAIIPEMATLGAAGMDLRCSEEEVVIARGEIALVGTSLSMEIPTGYEGQVRSRSGLAAKNGIFVLNAPGTIDSDYRGEVKVILANFGKADFIIKRGDRIAQLVIAKVPLVTIEETTDDLSQTQRGSGGFGSTGKN